MPTRSGTGLWLANRLIQSPNIHKPASTPSSCNGGSARFSGGFRVAFTAVEGKDSPPRPIQGAVGRGTKPLRCACAPARSAPRRDHKARRVDQWLPEASKGHRKRCERSWGPGVAMVLRCAPRRLRQRSAGQRFLVRHCTELRNGFQVSYYFPFRLSFHTSNSVSLSLFACHGNLRWVITLQSLIFLVN